MSVRLTVPQFLAIAAHLAGADVAENDHLDLWQRGSDVRLQVRDHGNRIVEHLSFDATGAAQS